MEPFDPPLLRVLDAMHLTAAADGQQRTWQANGWARSTAARWHREHDLNYYPNITYESFGLVHEHLILEEVPTPLDLPCVVDAAWMTASDGRRVLYVHCIRPRAAHDLYTQIPRRLTTGDAWQENRGLAHALDATGRITTLPPRVSRDPPRAPGAEDLLRVAPLLLPVSLELVGRRRTTEELWRAIYERLGERVWAYLPRQTRRWRRNGKQYVRDALRLLTRFGLVREHIIRYDALHVRLAEVIAITDDLAAIARYALLAEVYPAGDRYLVRAVGDATFLKEAWRARKDAWWLVDPERAPPTARPAYDGFDPRTATWRIA